MQDAHLAETRQSFPIRPQHPQLQRQNQQFEGRENFDYDVDCSVIFVRKTGWRYYREPRGNPPAASSSSTSQWPTSQWQTSWSSVCSQIDLKCLYLARIGRPDILWFVWLPTSSEKWWWFRFPGKNSRKTTGRGDRTPTHKTHLRNTVCSQATTKQWSRWLS